MPIPRDCLIKVEGGAEVSPEAQRIAIAEACGWAGFNPDNIPDCLQYTAKAPSGKWGPIPDYLNDLNAMHEAEKMLNSESGYHGIGGYGLYLVALEHNVSATAAQRAEAFLRTTGKWEITEL